MKKLSTIFFIVVFMSVIAGSAVAIMTVNKKQLRDGRELQLIKKGGQELWYVVKRKLADGPYKLSNGQDFTVKKGIMIDDKPSMLPGIKAKQSKGARGALGPKALREVGTVSPENCGPCPAAACCSE